jgi:hypothetical protein
MAIGIYLSLSAIMIVITIITVLYYSNKSESTFRYPVISFLMLSNLSLFALLFNELPSRLYLDKDKISVELNDTVLSSKYPVRSTVLIGDLKTAGTVIGYVDGKILVLLPNAGLISVSEAVLHTGIPIMKNE